MIDFVIAVNARGVKQRIPAAWLDHPVLGKGFKLPPSARPTSYEPTANATKATWVSHAVSLGLDAADAEAMTKAELAEWASNTTNSPEQAGAEPRDDAAPNDAAPDADKE